ncbi:MAG: CPBP family intramembrane metalloprotease [Euryarchaeota archaeon]|nr:CPBP family intramembrane metalloprotease [Euryarchaeota archaeon]
MSRIPFLDNAYEGKNNWWRYLLTSIMSFIVAPIIAGLFIGIFLLIYSLVYLMAGDVQPTIQMEQILSAISNPFSNPMFLILLLGIVYALSFLIFYICMRVIHKKRFISLINTGSKVNWMRILKGAGLWLAILALFSLLDMILNPGGYVITFSPNTFGILLILSFLVFPMQASFEEIFFRGYLMQGIGLLSKKPIILIMATSAIFAVIHLFNGTNLIMSSGIVISTFILGLMLGIIAIGENGIETVMGVHIANNMFIALIYNSTDSGLGGLPSIITVQSSDVFSGLPVLVIAASILIVILFWNRREDLGNVFR